MILHTLSLCMIVKNEEKTLPRCLKSVFGIFDEIIIADTGSTDISPKSAVNSMINYIGGSTWSQPNQELAWEIEAPEDGLYKLGFQFKQNTVMNGSAYRWLKIDGKTPFEEMKAVGFPYKTAWQYQDFAN